MNPTCGKSYLWIGRMAYHDFPCFHCHKLGYTTSFGKTSMIFRTSLVKIDEKNHASIPLKWSMLSTPCCQVIRTIPHRGIRIIRPRDIPMRRQAG
jgi:hypothetical protein